MSGDLSYSDPELAPQGYGCEGMLSVSRGVWRDCERPARWRVKFSGPRGDGNSYYCDMHLHDNETGLA